jgi:iron complex outermembrane receptor protein
MKKNKNESKKLMSSSVLLLGLFSFLLITSMPAMAEVATLKSSLAQITVTGKVTDSRNTPLDGISVAVKGAKTAVITDAKGMFTISVPDNGTLVFSAVGFISEEVAVKNNKVINVFLK